MDKSPTNPHYHTLDGCTFIYTYIQNTQIIVAQFLHMGELTPQQLTKSHFYVVPGSSPVKPVGASTVF